MNRTNSVKFATIAVFVIVLAVPALAQQTQTNCTLNGNTANCTSNSTPTFQQSMDSFNKSMDATGKNIAAARQANMNDKVKIEYCHQNPSGSITTGSGQIRGCVDAIAYVKAACDVRKWKGLCGKDWAWIKTFKAPSPMSSASPPTPTSFAAPSTLADQAPTTASAATVSSASPTPVTEPTGPAPLTPEQKDALSYCERNPTATITWNNGTVSPCSSLLGPR
jgi:hypothetical protein